MRWPTAMLLAALATAGCRNARPASDPFLPLPRTRIPPPSTGAASGAPDACYTNPPPPMSGTAPVWPAPASGAPAAGSPSGFSTPPGGFPYPQPAPSSTSGARNDAPVPGPAAERSMTASRTNYVRTVDDEPSAIYEGRRQGVSESTAPQLASDDSPSGPIDIMDLPLASVSARRITR